MGHEAHTVQVAWTGDHQDQMEEEGCPADNEDSQEDSECNGPFHAGPLVDGVVTRKSSNPLDMRTGQHKHVAVKGGHDEKHGKEHGDQADDDRGGFRVEDEDYSTSCAEDPDSTNDAARSPHCHDVVVPQCIEDCNVPVGKNEKKLQ